VSKITSKCKGFKLWFLLKYKHNWQSIKRTDQVNYKRLTVWTYWAIVCDTFEYDFIFYKTCRGMKHNLILFFINTSYLWWRYWYHLPSVGLHLLCSQFWSTCLEPKACQTRQGQGYCWCPDRQLSQLELVTLLK